MNYVQPADYRLTQRNYLLEVARALSQDLSLEGVLYEILRVSSQLLHAEAGVVALRWDTSTQSPTFEAPFRVVAQYLCPDAFINEFDKLLYDTVSLTNDPSGQILLEVRRQLGEIANTHGIDLTGMLGLPLRIKNQWVGVLIVFRSHRSPVTPDERLMFQAFADQAAIAINNARLFLEINREKTRLNAILEGSADGIYLLDIAGRIVRWNRAIARLTGLPSEQAIGQSESQALLWASAISESLESARKQGWPFNHDATLYVEGTLQRLNGPDTAVGITYAPIFDGAGNLVNIVANVRDISHFREAERLKSTFISIVSHELKTPVSLIKGYAGTLRRTDANWSAETIQNGLQVIEEEADRLTRLIEDLLEASRLQAGGLRLEFAALDMAALARSVAESFAAQVSDGRIVVEFPPEFPLIQGDAVRLRQVFNNLLSNAIKYDQSNGKITLRGLVQAQNILISVSDEGPGIPNEELEQVFDRFYRAATPATQRAQGAGLGLYLTRAIVQAHGGRIWARPNRPRGVIFYISLPRPAQLINS